MCSPFKIHICLLSFQFISIRRLILIIFFRIILQNIQMASSSTFTTILLLFTVISPVLLQSTAETLIRLNQLRKTPVAQLLKSRDTVDYFLATSRAPSFFDSGQAYSFEDQKFGISTNPSQSSITSGQKSYSDISQQVLRDAGVSRTTSPTQTTTTPTGSSFQTQQDLLLRFSNPVTNTNFDNNKFNSNLDLGKINLPTQQTDLSKQILLKLNSNELGRVDKTQNKPTAPTQQTQRQVDASQDILNQLRDNRLDRNTQTPSKSTNPQTQTKDASQQILADLKENRLGKTVAQTQTQSKIESGQKADPSQEILRQLKNSQLGRAPVTKKDDTPKKQQNIAQKILAQLGTGRLGNADVINDTKKIDDAFKNQLINQILTQLKDDKLGKDPDNKPSNATRQNATLIADEIIKLLGQKKLARDNTTNSTIEIRDERQLQLNVKTLNAKVDQFPDTEDSRRKKEIADQLLKMFLEEKSGGAKMPSLVDSKSSSSAGSSTSISGISSPNLTKSP